MGAGEEKQFWEIIGLLNSDPGTGKKLQVNTSRGREFLNISHNILFIVIIYSYKSEHILSNNIHSYKNMKNKILVLL